jgi:hypothetical protein
LTRAELEDFDIPHRTKVRKAILQAWEKHYLRLKEEMKVGAEMATEFNLTDTLTFFLARQTSLGAISCTADIWSDGALRPFLAITAHWIQRRPDGSLAMRADLVAFSYIPGAIQAPILRRLPMLL